MVRLIGNCCNNLLFRNSGNDQTYAIGKNNFIHSGEGNDLVTSLGFNNVIVGGQGADTIVNVGKNNLVLGDQLEIPDLSDLTIDLSGLGFDFAIPDLDLSGLGFDFAIPDLDLSGRVRPSYDTFSNQGNSCLAKLSWNPFKNHIVN